MSGSASSPIGRPSAGSRGPAPRVGLVLGAGGIVGQAYHAGVLSALELDLGWDPRSATVVVGSSAGSITGALLRFGIPASDLAAWSVGGPISVEYAPVLELLRQAGEALPHVDPRDLLRPWKAPSPSLLLRLARQPLVTALTMLPAGRVDLLGSASLLARLIEDHWPTGLKVCATRMTDGRRIVFDAESASSVPLTTAVAASCAIPSYFSPVEIDGHRHIDGGIGSSTNADVLRSESLDMVVIVCPMAAAHPLGRRLDAPMRLMAHRRLHAEGHQLRAQGTEVVWFEPGPRALEAMGLNPMADDRSRRVLQASFLETGKLLGSPAVRRRLEPLLGPTRRQRHLAVQQAAHDASLPAPA